MGVYIAGGAGVAGLFLGSIAGGLMLSKKGVVADNCAVGVDGIARCTHDGAVAGNSAKTLGLVSSIGYGVAIAGLATAAVLFFTEPSAPKAGTGRSAPSRQAKARWIGPGVLSMGREGSIFGVQGVW
jgi:hypothetical protein